jgi:hypothetical protein
MQIGIKKSFLTTKKNSIEIDPDNEIGHGWARAYAEAL